jgi:hypothetical protein
MKAITLRNFSPNLDNAIRKRARAKGTSVNKAVIGLLEEHLTQDKTKGAELHHDLEDLSGSWTADAAAAFDEALAKQRTL